jgi:predicted nucleic acid-binding protein
VKLVVDASVAVAAAATSMGFARFRGFELVAPPLLWIEVVSSLHAAMWRGELRRDQAEPTLRRALAAPIRRLTPSRLQQEAWVLADEFGWAKTYDANYVALARLLGCRLVTLDARLRRGTARLGFVVGPTEPVARA